MPADTLRGIVEVGKPTKVGALYVLVDRTDDPDKVYIRVAQIKGTLLDPVKAARLRKRLTLRTSQE